MEGANALLSPQVGTIIWTLITFGILLIGLRLVAWKPVLGLLEERERAIQSALDESRKAREEAGRQLEEGKESLKKARQEMAAVIEKGQKEAERVRHELMEKARSDADETRKKGLEEIEREKRAALAEIRGAAVDLAVAAAGRIVTSSMDEKAQRKVAADFLDQLDEGGRPS
jgi:F-type H+-transporting ATPase subunit b